VEAVGCGGVRDGLITNGEAALGLSARQMRRVRVAKLGPKGVVHGNGGRVPAHRVAGQVRARLVELRLDKYVDFNDQHFTEKLSEEEGLVLSRPTVRRVLLRVRTRTQSSLSRFRCLQACPRSQAKTDRR
jgi:hypothetical protein